MDLQRQWRCATSRSRSEIAQGCSSARAVNGPARCEATRRDGESCESRLPATRWRRVGACGVVLAVPFFNNLRVCDSSSPVFVPSRYTDVHAAAGPRCGSAGFEAEHDGVRSGCDLECGYVRVGIVGASCGVLVLWQGVGAWSGPAQGCAHAERAHMVGGMSMC